MARKIIKPCYHDKENSVDLFDGDRLNEFKEMYCVQPGILLSQVSAYWELYLSEEAEMVAEQRLTS